MKLQIKKGINNIEHQQSLNNETGGVTRTRNLYAHGPQFYGVKV